MAFASGNASSTLARAYSRTRGQCVSTAEDHALCHAPSASRESRIRRVSPPRPAPPREPSSTASRAAATASADSRATFTAKNAATALSLIHI